jgi:AAHS family 4-hydroxybenzoate transporter-like MFS transporter
MNHAQTQTFDLGALLDNGRWTLYQKLIVALTACAVIFDGLDIQIVGFAIPAIAHDWGLAKSMFASVLAAGLFGVAIGSALGGLIGDRVGRRPALIASVFLFAASTFGMSTTHSLAPLLILRLCAGLGIGGALPNAATLTSEYTPLRQRPLATTLTIICIPIGGVVAGTIASALLATHSWRLLFVIAGTLPLALGVALLLLLPESPRFLARKRGNTAQLNQILIRSGRPVVGLNDAMLHGSEQPKVPLRGVRTLFAGRQARDTFGLWAAFFFCLLTVYLAFNWLPSVLTAIHFSAKEASQGLTLYNVGGIFGAISVGWWISYRGSRTPMLLSAAVAILSGLGAAVFLHLPAPSHRTALLIIGLHGLAVNAVQTTLYALATHIYPTAIRSTGVAFALAVGRTGAILSAYLGAALLLMPASIYFLILAATSAVAMLAIAIIKNHIGRRQPAHASALPAALE